LSLQLLRWRIHVVRLQLVVVPEQSSELAFELMPRKLQHRLDK
jgi:hypothetical protein